MTVIEHCKAMTAELENSKWKKDECRLELIVAAMGTGVMAELMLEKMGEEIKRSFDVEEWLSKYEEQWLKKNKESEFSLVKEMFRYMAN